MAGPMTPGREAEIRDDVARCAMASTLADDIYEILDAMALERARADEAEARLALARTRADAAAIIHTLQSHAGRGWRAIEP